MAPPHWAHTYKAALKDFTFCDIITLTELVVHCTDRKRDGPEVFVILRPEVFYLIREKESSLL